MKALGIISFLLVAACADRARFEPTNVTTTGQGGQPAAGYDIRMGPDQQPHAHVNVWSRGATIIDDRTIIRLAVEIRNTGDELLQLAPDELRLTAFSNQGTPLPDARLVRISSENESVTVPPGEAVTIALRFAMPMAVDPDRIASMRLRWVVDHDDGDRYVQFTDFQRVEDQYATTMVYYDPIWGYYDPFLYGYGPAYLHSRSYHVPVRRIYVRDRDRHVRYEGDERPRTRNHRR